MYAVASSPSNCKVDLEIEYSPSCSSNRAIDKDPKVLIENFVHIHREETDRVSEIYKCRRDFPYGDSQAESMDIYFRDEESNTPIFLYIHGGYWTALDKNVSGICVAPLVERGHRVAVLDYNLCPNVTLEELVQQIRKFLNILLKYAVNTNAPKIALCGHSAGAHLIATLLQQECFDLPHINLIKEIFLISGIYDLRELFKTEAGNPGNILSLNEESARKLSPILFNIPKCAKNIQVHIIVAEHDSHTFRGQSKKYFKKLRKEYITTWYSVFPGYDHFTIIEDMRDEQSLISKYLLNSLDG